MILFTTPVAGGIGLGGGNGTSILITTISSGWTRPDVVVMRAQWVNTDSTQGSDRVSNSNCGKYLFYWHLVGEWRCTDVGTIGGAVLILAP